jgi:hypothetical protein
MPSIESNRQAGKTAREQGNIKPVQSVNAVNPVPPIPTYPSAPNPDLRTTLPASYVQQPDQQRQWQTGAVRQQRIPPTSATGNAIVGAQAASQSIVSARSGSGGVLFETDNIPNALQSVLNLIAGTGTTLTADSQGGVTITGGGSIIPNPQTGTEYIVLLTDFSKLISVNNPAGGTVILPGPSAGSFSFIQAVNFNAAAQSASTTITNTIRNLMILSVKISDGGASVPTVVDTNGNVWTMIATEPDGGNIPTSFWYAFNIAGGPNTITVTNPSSSVFCLPTVLEYAGFDQNDPLDTFTIHEAAVAVVTTGFPNCLVYNGIRFNTTQNPTAGSGFLSRYNDTQEIDQDQLVATLGTVVTGDSVPTVIGSGAVCFTASFKTATGPSSDGFPVGWYTYVENRGPGTFIVTSSAMIDGVVQNITLPPNTGVLFAFDGTDWFTFRGDPQLTIPSTAVVEINGVGTSQDKQFFINGVFDGSTVWGVDINGTPDGG